MPKYKCTKCEARFINGIFEKCPECGASSIFKVEDYKFDVNNEVANKEESMHINFEICFNCGTKLVEGSNFCSECGTNINDIRDEQKDICQNQELECTDAEDEYFVINNMKVDLVSFYYNNRNSKIKAIKELKDLTGADLREAKAAIDFIFEKMEKGRRNSSQTSGFGQKLKTIEISHIVRTTI